jgi:3-hydroxybutyryl-CoA dehydratase
MSITFSEITLGYEIPSKSKVFTQEMITANAEGSLDFNPIHVNAEYVKKINFLGKGTTIAHGMMTLAFMGKTVTDWAFIEPVRPGDEITVVTKATEIHPRHDGKNFVVFDIACTNQDGKTVAAGETSAYLL